MEQSGKQPRGKGVALLAVATVCLAALAFVAAELVGRSLLAAGVTTTNVAGLIACPLTVALLALVAVMLQRLNRR